MARCWVGLEGGSCGVEASDCPCFILQKRGGPLLPCTVLWGKFWAVTFPLRQQVSARGISPFRIPHGRRPHPDVVHRRSVLTTQLGCSGTWETLTLAHT